MVFYRLIFFLFIYFGFVCSPVYAQQQIVREITLKGNEKTKESIIYREIIFKKGDTLQRNDLIAAIDKSRTNLLNTSLFHFVTVDTVFEHSDVFITFNFTERWYLWPFPLLKISDRDFNVWWKTKDLSRLNYGFFIQHDNITGRKDLLKLMFTAGYDHQSILYYKLPYINKKQTIGLAFESGLKFNHEVAISTENNKLTYYHNPDDYAQKLYYSALELSYRPNIYATHLFNIDYQYTQWNDTIDGSDFYLHHVPEVLNYHLKNIFTLSYQFKLDHRDFKAYPLKGYYFDLEAAKYNFGQLFHLKTNIRKFFQTGKRTYLHAGFIGKLSNKARPVYVLQQDMGYNNDYVRGYEYYVLNGYNWWITKTNFSFALIPTRIEKINFIKTKKFNTLHYALYLNAYVDCGYMKDVVYYQTNPLNNRFLLGYGIGLDYVTYYDKVLRIEFSMNKKGERGVYLHFVAPI